jgi:transcriptional regulator with XRE-family HTH domain
MKARLLEFLKAENKSSAQFAEEIGVQPSGISHILSGRNNPSLDFVLKMLEKYQFLSTDWLLFGKGSMYKDSRIQTLFDDTESINQGVEVKVGRKESGNSTLDFRNIEKSEPKGAAPGTYKSTTASIERIVWFYDNNCFEEYFPRH